MKVLLIEPPRWNGWPIIRADRCERPAMYGGIPFPYWLASTAKYLKENKITVDILDANAHDMTWNNIKSHIKKYTPNLILFSGANCSIDYDIKTADIAKKIDKNIITAIIEPILTPRKPEEIFTKHPYLDIILTGEPENISLSICKNKFKADGIIYKKGNKIITNPAKIFDIFNLSMPAYDMLPMEKYTNIPIRISRGCPYNCTYCTLGSQSDTSAFDKKLRFRSMTKVIEELEYLSNKGMNISFADETLTIDKKRIISLCNKIIKKKLNIKFTCQTRVDKVDKEILTKLKEAGCTKIGYGIESGDNHILAKIRKNITVSLIKKAFRQTKEIGIPTSAFNIIGLPGETKETIRKTIELNKEIKPDSLQIATATPVIGTEFWDYCIKNKYLTVDEEVAERAIIGTHCLIKYPNLNCEDIYKSIKKGLMEMNYSYLTDIPTGTLPKLKFIGRRIITAYKLHRLPNSEFPGKTVIFK